MYVQKIKKKLILKKVIVFSEKIDLSHHEFSVFLLLWPWKLGQGH